MSKLGFAGISDGSEKGYRWRFDEIAKYSMVGLFFAFPVALGLANVLSAVVLVSWIMAGNYTRRWCVIRRSPLVLPLLLLYGWILVGGIYADALPSDVILHYSKYSKFLFAVILISLLDEHLWRLRCWRAFAVAMLFILSSVYANIWLDLPWSATHAQGWGVDHHVIGDYITQNVMMSFFVVLLIQYARTEMQTGRKFVLYVTAILAILSITHLSQGRTGYVLVAVGLLVFAIVTAPKRYKFLMAGIVGIFLASAIATSQGMLERFELAVVEAKRSNVDSASSIGHRIHDYRKTPELIKQSPIFGLGTGAYHTRICKVIDDPTQCFRHRWHPHNQFLFFWADNGLIGLALFVFLLFRLAKPVEKSSQSEAAVFLSFTAILIVDSMINSPLWSARESHFFMFIMALLNASARDLFRWPLASQRSIAVERTVDRE